VSAFQNSSVQNNPLKREYSPAQLAAQARGRQNLKPIQKGQVLNPGGWNQTKYHQARKLCADKSLEAAQTLIDLMKDDDARIRYMAAISIMERGIGKPRDHTEEEALASRISLEGLDKGERAVLAMLLQKALGLDKAKDAAPSEPVVIEGNASESDPA
jgi:hypothetical protein